MPEIGQQLQPRIGNARRQDRGVSRFHQNVIGPVATSVAARICGRSPVTVELAATPPSVAAQRTSGWDAPVRGASAAPRRRRWPPDNRASRSPAMLAARLPRETGRQSPGGGLNTDIEAGSAQMPPQNVPNRIRRSSRSACRMATSCAIAPPMEKPSRWTRGRPQVVQQSDNVTRHDWRIRSRRAGLSLRPVPRLSNDMTEQRVDSRLMKAVRPRRAAQAIAIDQADGRTLADDLMVKRHRGGSGQWHRADLTPYTSKNTVSRSPCRRMSNT